MEIRFTPEEQKQLELVATKSGINPERLVKNAALRLLAPGDESSPPVPGSVVEEMRALRARLKPDPEGLTIRDYVLHGSSISGDECIEMTVPSQLNQPFRSTRIQKGAGRTARVARAFVVVWLARKWYPHQTK
jgi:hypothetical protein